MSYCKICGDEENLSRVLRFWSPDDGWMTGRLCQYCAESEAKRKPKPSDYAWDKRGDCFSDEQEAIDDIFG